MGRGMQCGSFLLLAATVLLVVATISAPVTHQISFLDVGSGSAMSTFGVFGYCQSSTSCSSHTVGYDIGAIAGVSNASGWNNAAWKGVTGALILHPIAAGLSLLACLIALCSDHLGFLLASLVSLLAFLVALVAMVIDFTLFGVLRHEINDDTSSGASFGNAIWMVLAAVVILFFASFATCFECCGSRRRARDGDYVGAGKYRY